jgi:hypothetical protein
MGNITRNKALKSDSIQQTAPELGDKDLSTPLCQDSASLSDFSLSTNWGWHSQGITSNGMPGLSWGAQPDVVHFSLIAHFSLS